MSSVPRPYERFEDFPGISPQQLRNTRFGNHFGAISNEHSSSELRVNGTNQVYIFGSINIFST